MLVLFFLSQQKTGSLLPHAIVRDMKGLIACGRNLFCPSSAFSPLCPFPYRRKKKKNEQHAEAQAPPPRPPMSPTNMPPARPMAPPSALPSGSLSQFTAPLVWLHLFSRHALPKWLVRVCVGTIAFFPFLALPKWFFMCALVQLHSFPSLLHPPSGWFVCGFGWSDALSASSSLG